MKTQRTFQLLLAGIVLMLLNACATYPRTGSRALVGTWTNALGTVWTINADNIFHVVAAKPPHLGQSYRSRRYGHNPGGGRQDRERLQGPGRLSFQPQRRKHSGVYIGPGRLQGANQKRDPGLAPKINTCF